MRFEPAELAFMRKSIEQARESIAEDRRAHPRVGVVIVNKAGHEIEAHRGELGRGDHAEFTALEKKGAEEVFAGATVYSTLEPCTTRSEPKVPCAERLVERRVRRVFVGFVDPDQRISGRGIQLLRDASIDVQLYPEDLADELLELNRDFIRATRKQAAKETPPHGHLLERSLDGWYQCINRLYWNRNFPRDANAIFTHLVEIVGGMSQLASEKTKPGARPEAFVSKAIAWWLALCGKVGVKSVETLLWAKFPGACPYCQRPEHNNDICTERKAASRGPDWDSLAALGASSSAKRPQRLGDWQRMFAGIYQVQQTEDYGNSFARLTEEMGELAEAIRVFPAAPGYFLSEAADVFAWLMKVQNVFENKKGVARAERGKAIEREFAKAYPDLCLDCGEQPCACPPILPGTIGRIAHEVPGKRGTVGEEGYFMTNQSAAELFGGTT